MVKKGNEAVNQVYATVSRILNSTAKGKELLAHDAHVEQRLAYYICRDLGLICGYVDEENKSEEKEWLHGCTRPPRARGLCARHFQKKYYRYVYEED